ncbi:hypothetical protein ACFV2X_49930 [Streptomyces sp. NPDC059679]|uniref:hypothetical protein n=1 Tax=Streptomyces sp. NPDC059679 TaxID=3346903 RepID=UPI0036AFB72C
MSNTVNDLLAQAARDYKKHNDPDTQAEARSQRATARAHGNEAAASSGSAAPRGGAAR